MSEADSPLSSDDAALFAEGVRLFNQRCFFDAHDVWEELWTETRGVKKLFFQGLIQVAVAYYHALNANNAGAANLLPRAIEKLQRYAPSCCGIDLEPLLPVLRNHASWPIPRRDLREVVLDPETLPSLTIHTHIS